MRVHVRQQLSGGRLRLVEAGTGGRQRGQADVCCLAAAFEFEADLELEGALQLLLLQADGEFTRVLKLLGQLQDKGNTDLIKHYIELYSNAFLLHTLQKYSPKAWLSRSSSPKMLPACPALYSMTTGLQRQLGDEQRGRVFELAVGTELGQQPGELFYWRERNAEVDYVYRDWGQLYAIEVKSG